MRINAIQTPNFYPVFTSSVNKKKKIEMPMSDSFVLSRNSFDIDAEIFYSKLQKSMEILTPQDIIKKAEKVSEKTGVDINEVYNTMGLLSQYSSYKSLATIQDSLKKHKIENISNLTDYYRENNFEVPICLTNVLHYIAIKSFGFKYEYYGLRRNEKNALFVDSNLIKIAKNDPYFYKGRNTHLFYIENFENGYNFLNQSKNFEDFTIDVIEKAKKYQKHNKKSLNYNVRYVLNGDVLKNIDYVSDGEGINIIRKKNICTPEKIADNLNPIMPDYNSFKRTIDIIHKASMFCNDFKSGGEKFVIHSLNNMFEVTTPKQFSKYLTEMHKKINDCLIEHKRDLDKVYYIIPNNEKSFVLVNYQYQKANNINDAKNYVMMKFCQNSDIAALPDNSTIVILDDYMLSGKSMQEEQFPYENMAKRTDILEDKNIEIIFAPMFVSKNGYEDFKQLISSLKRPDSIVIGKVLAGEGKNTPYKREYPAHKYLSSSIMPYMGPDSNIIEFVPLYTKFLYSADAQKEPLISFDNFI